MKTRRFYTLTIASAADFVFGVVGFRRTDRRAGGGSLLIARMRIVLPAEWKKNWASLEPCICRLFHEGNCFPNSGNKATGAQHTRTTPSPIGLRPQEDASV